MPPIYFYFFYLFFCTSPIGSIAPFLVTFYFFIGLYLFKQRPIDKDLYFQASAILNNAIMNILILNHCA